MRSLFPTLSIAALLAGGLAAQTRTIVSPPVNKNSEGGSSDYRPFNIATASATFRKYHWQEVHDLGKTTIGKIAGISYRRDGYAYPGTKSPAYYTDAEIAISTAKTTSATMSRTFASNDGTDKVVVMARKKVNFAPFPYVGQTGSVQPFFFSMPFDTAKVLVFKGGSLCVDIKVYDNNLYDATTRTYKRIYFDRAYNSTGGRSIPSRRACYGSDKNNYLPFYGFAYNYYYKTQNKLRMYAYSYYGLTGGAGFWLITGAALPNSVPLPGNCYLHVDLSKMILAVPGSGVGYGGRKSTTYYYPPYSGTTRQYLDLPWQNSFRGAKLASQMFGIDPQANSLGLTSTNLVDLSLPTYDPNGLPLSYTYAYGTFFGRTYGYGPFKSAGLVTQFKLN